jgi:cell division septation protein DedD
MASDYRNRGRWDDDDDDDGRLTRPSGGVGSSSIAYESGRRRSGRRRIVTLAVVLIVVGGFTAIVWNAYNQGRRSNGDGVVPLIEADNSPVKVKPEDPGGMNVPNQDKLIYDRLGQNATPGVERLLPPPEEPVARPEPPHAAPPAPAESLLSEAAPTPAPRAPVQSSNEIEPPSITPREPAAPAPSANKPAQSEKAEKPAKPPAEVASTPPAASAPASGGYRIQLAAVRSHDAAEKEWARLLKANKDLLGKLKLTVAQANLGARGTFYRVQGGPVGDRQAATDLCAKLKARNVSCIIVKQ